MGLEGSFCSIDVDVGLNSPRKTFTVYHRENIQIVLEWLANIIKAVRTSNVETALELDASSGHTDTGLIFIWKVTPRATFPIVYELGFVRHIPRFFCGYTRRIQRVGRIVARMLPCAAHENSQLCLKKEQKRLYDEVQTFNSSIRRVALANMTLLV